jgi:LysR family nitrogen assimilation transcriptional regulator
MLKERHLTPSIDVKQVHYFMTLAECGTISKAADALGLAQPSLSEHIVRLEKKLNATLAIRGPRGITLTEAGRLLAREGQGLIDAARSLTNGLHELRRELSGTVSLALPPSISALLSIPLAETVRLEYPGIKLHITEGLTGHILDWIERETIDMGFVYMKVPTTTFQARPFLREDIFLIAAHDNIPVEPDADGNYVIEADQLGKLPLVMPSLPHSARYAVESFASENNIALDVVLELDSLSQVIEMVSRASAYTFLPHAPVAAAVRDGKLALVRIADTSFQRTAYLTRKRARVVSMASVKIEAMMTSILKELIEKYDVSATLIEEGASIN